MSHSPDLKKVDRLLAAWAEWVCSDSYTLGYPREAPFAHNTPTDLENFRVTEGGDELIAVDQAVASLHKKLRKVVKFEYLCKGPASVKADKMKVSPATYWRWLREARYQLAQKLDNV